MSRIEAEPLPQSIHEEPLVGEVKRRGDVREEHKGRRRDGRLRGVEDAHFASTRAGGRVDGGDGLNEPVQLRRRDAAGARLGHLVDRLE